MRRRPSANTTVREAAKRFRRFLREQSGGRMPRSVVGYHRLADRFDIACGPLRACPDGFTGRLWYCSDADQWLIGYNPDHPRRQRMKYILHELAEWLAVNDFPSLFEDLPDVWDTCGNTRVYYYDGGANPDDLRHRIAREVERLCFRR